MRKLLNQVNQIKEFAISCEDENGRFESLPPPVFTRSTIPHSYKYSSKEFPLILVTNMRTNQRQ